jgi:hypothetical protein
MTDFHERDTVPLLRDLKTTLHEREAKLRALAARIAETNSRYLHTHDSELCARAVCRCSLPPGRNSG